MDVQGLLLGKQGKTYPKRESGGWVDSQFSAREKPPGVFAKIH
jgi:hypothetical protein